MSEYVGIGARARELSSTAQFGGDRRLSASCSVVIFPTGFDPDNTCLSRSAPVSSGHLLYSNYPDRLGSTTLFPFAV